MENESHNYLLLDEKGMVIEQNEAFNDNILGDICDIIHKGKKLSEGNDMVISIQFEKSNLIIKEISKEILSGKIDIKPYYNLGNNQTPCKYCSYKTICKFKPGTKCNNYNYIYKKEKQEILDEIRNRVK